MTTKEKAQELIDSMCNTPHCGIKHFPNKNYCDCSEINFFQAKQCAVIAVDKILEVLYSLKLGNALSEEIEFYEQVKHELTKQQEQ